MAAATKDVPASQDQIANLAAKVGNIPVGDGNSNLSQRVSDLESMVDHYNLVIKTLPKLEPLGFPVELLVGDDAREAKEIFKCALETSIKSMFNAAVATTRFKPEMMAKYADDCILFAEEVTKRWLFRRNSARSIQQQAKQSKG